MQPIAERFMGARHLVVVEAQHRLVSWRHIDVVADDVPIPYTVGTGVDRQIETLQRALQISLNLFSVTYIDGRAGIAGKDTAIIETRTAAIQKPAILTGAVA